jgi:hypothetical protein
MLYAIDDSELYALLRIIDGTDFPYTTGLRSSPNATTANDELVHAGCLELERRGLIQRHYEDPAAGLIVWMPFQAATTN